MTDTDKEKHSYWFKTADTILKAIGKDSCYKHGLILERRDFRKEVYVEGLFITSKSAGKTIRLDGKGIEESLGKILGELIINGEKL